MKIERILIPQPAQYEERSLERLIARHQGTEESDAVTLDLQEEQRRQQGDKDREKSKKQAQSEADRPQEAVSLDLLA